MLLLSFSIFAVMSLRFKSFFICQVSCLCGFLFFLIITVRQTTPNIVTYNIVILFITHIFCGSGIQLWLEWLGAWVISGFFTHMADTWAGMNWDWAYLGLILGYTCVTHPCGFFQHDKRTFPLTGSFWGVHFPRHPGRSCMVLHDLIISAILHASVYT